MKKYLYLLFVIGLSACGTQKDIDVKLPPYNPQLVVECYLQPGKPYRLSLLESQSYFESPTPPIVDGATVVIEHNGILDTLKNGLFADTSTTVVKGYNYGTDTTVKVPFDYVSTFNLIIKDKKGRTVTASTRILPIVPIDSVSFEFSKLDSQAFALTFFYDDLSTTDYYRFVVTKNDASKSSALDYITDDQIATTSKTALGGPYNLKQGTPVVVSLYHITKEFYDFTRSINDAKDANGNPFAQPSVIKSNINGGLGIFTGLSGDQKKLTVPTL